MLDRRREVAKWEAAVRPGAACRTAPRCQATRPVSCRPGTPPCDRTEMVDVELPVTGTRRRREPAWPMLRPMPMKRFAAPLVLVCLLTGCGAASVTPTAEGPQASAPEKVASAQPILRTGSLPENGAASCVELYNAKTIGNRAFAFDGTITNVSPGGTNKADKGTLDTVAVTFQVNEWFKGGTSPTVKIDLMSPTNNIAGDDTPAYEQGTRLLVSGEPRWGGEPLTDAIAWSCGFTRYYEATVADAWRQGTAI